MEQTNRIILCVDDEREILSALQRSLRQKADRILTATSGEEGLALLEEIRPRRDRIRHAYAGYERSRVSQSRPQFAPHTFRILLTGHADMEAAISAINRGKFTAICTNPGMQMNSDMPSSRGLNATNSYRQIWR